MSDLTDKYNTALSPAQEAQFQAWAKSIGHQGDTKDYDLRGAWKDGGTQAANGHFPDTYKKPNHPTFSDESIYNGKDGHQGGHWGEQNGQTTFTPGPTNLRTYGAKGLEDYFKKREPDARLVLGREQVLYPNDVGPRP